MLTDEHVHLEADQSETWFCPSRLAVAPDEGVSPGWSRGQSLVFVTEKDVRSRITQTLAVLPIPLVSALAALVVPGSVAAQGILIAVPVTVTPGPESPPAHPAASPSRRCCDLPMSIPSVYLHSGEFHHEAVDLLVPARGLDFVWQRSYRSRLGPNTEQGNGWDFSYDLRIVRAGHHLRLMDGNGRSDVYRPLGVNSWVAQEFFREGAFNADGTFSLVFADRGEWKFEPLNGSPHAGKIRTMSDRNGNTMSFRYDALGRLVNVVDPLRRVYSIAYRSDGFLGSVTDFAGRSVVYDYYKTGEAGGGAGDLKSARSPIVTGTPNGNDFPAGKITTYTYSAGLADDRLNHNLLTITDPKGQTWLSNVYASATEPTHPLFDRLLRQQRGDQGDVVDVRYALPGLALAHAPGPPAPSIIAIVNDRMGYVTEFDHDGRGRCVAKRDYTGRADPDTPTTSTANRPGHPLRAGDPAFFETRWSYNEDSRVTRIVHPNGNVTQKTYELAVNPQAPWRSRGNLRELERLRGTHPSLGTRLQLVEKFQHAIGFGSCCGTDFVTVHTDARGTTTAHDYDQAGNRVRTRHPIAGIVDDYTYNAFGQMLTHIWPDNGNGARRTDDRKYYASGAQTGYLASRVVDVAGLALATSWTYDARGNAIQTTDPRNVVWTFDFNQLNQVVRRTSPPVQLQNGAIVQYEADTYFDANDNVVRVDVQNFDDQGALAANSHYTTSFDYEILNRRARMTEESGPGQVITEYQYDANRNLTLTRLGEATNGRQSTNVVRQEYDARDLLWRVVRGEGDPDHTTAQYDYDGNGNQVRFVEGLEAAPRTTDHTYDAFDRRVRAQDPMGNVTTYHYDANGNVEKVLVAGELCDVVGSTGNVRMAETSSTYDPMNRLIQRTDQHFDPATQQSIGDGTSVLLQVWTDASQLASTTDDNGNVTRFAYDTALRLDTKTDALGNVERTAYDSNGNVVQVTWTEKSDGGRPDEVFVSTRVYDTLNRLFSEKDPLNHEHRYGYDSRDNRTLVIDALGNRTHTTYDGLRRRLRDTHVLTDTGTGAGNQVGKIETARAWDDSSRLVSQTDDHGNATTYVFDALNRRVAVRYADGTSETCRFDVHDNEVGRVDANGTAVASTYDLANRLSGRTILPGPGVSSDTTSEIWKFDGQSRLVHAQDNDSTVTRSWDSLSALRTETQNGAAVTYSHDGMGNRVGLVYPGGKQVSRTFDRLNRIKTITNAGPAASYDYVGPVRVEMRTTGPGVVQSSYRYDGARRMVRVEHVATRQQLDVRGFEWDAMNNKIQVTNERAEGPGTVHDYAYDSRYRMVRVLVSNNAGVVRDTRYTVDGVGNRRTVTGGSCPGLYVMDPTAPVPADWQVNQYTSTPCIGCIEYDLNGSEILRNGESAMLRDFSERVVQHLNLVTGAITRYAYDALGRRILRIRPSGGPAGTTQYLYDGWHTVEERDGSGQVTATYVRGRAFDEIVEMTRGSETRFFFADDLGSVRVLTTASGKPAEFYEYEDYGMPVFMNAKGVPIVASAVANDYLFTGQRWDGEMRFYDYKTRHMDPLLGRFVARDRIGLWGDENNLGNGLAYVGNNPATKSDPLGLDSDPYDSWWAYGIPRIAHGAGIANARNMIVVAAVNFVLGHQSDNPSPDGSSSGLAPEEWGVILAQIKKVGGPLTVTTPFSRTWLGENWSLRGKGVETLWNPNPEDFMYDAGIMGHGAGGGIDLNGGSIQEQLKNRGKKGGGSGGGDGDDAGKKGNNGVSSGEDFPGPDELVNPVPVTVHRLRVHE